MHTDPPMFQRAQLVAQKTFNSKDFNINWNRPDAQGSFGRVYFAKQGFLGGQVVVNESTGSVEQAVFAHLKNDSAGFEAFSKSSIAEELIRTRPHLAVNDMTTAFGDKQVQADLAELMSAAQQVANCERMTVWMVNNSEIFSVCAERFLLRTQKRSLLCNFTEEVASV